MGTVCISGRMVPSTKETGNLAKPVDTVSSHLLTRTQSKANGSKVNLMGMLYTSIQMVQNMKDSGRMICSTARAKNLGWIAHTMKETILRERNMVKVSTCGLMVQCMLETGMKIGSRAKAPTNGKMVETTKANGGTTTCTVTASTHGPTDVDTTANMRKITSTVMDYINGLTVAFTKDTGTKASSMARVSTSPKKVISR